LCKVVSVPDDARFERTFLSGLQDMTSVLGNFRSDNFRRICISSFLLTTDSSDVDDDVDDAADADNDDDDVVQ